MKWKTKALNEKESPQLTSFLVYRLPFNATLRTEEWKGHYGDILDDEDTKLMKLSWDGSKPPLLGDAMLSWVKTVATSHSQTVFWEFLFLHTALNLQSCCLMKNPECLKINWLAYQLRSRVFINWLFLLKFYDTEIFNTSIFVLTTFNFNFLSTCLKFAN